jgi:pseudaminic acid biosynthesis-associated methylase
MNMKVDQLATWQGEFGKEYTDRNVVDWQQRLPAFARMLEGLELRRVLEVGCNRGHNLRTLAEFFGNRAEVFGVEPNPYALSIARAGAEGYSVVPGNAFDLPFKDGYFDLAFTFGVLIHIAPDTLADAMREIARVSRRYILASEYFAEQDTEIEYRGRPGLMWKCDFLKHYQEAVPGLALVRNGRWGVEDGFSGTAHWWLLEKSAV